MRKIFVNSMLAVAAVAMVSCGAKQTAKQSAAIVVTSLVFILNKLWDFYKYMEKYYIAS